MTIVKSLLLILAFAGYLLGYRKHMRLPLCFFPALTVSACALLLYGFALVGMMRAGFALVIAFGLFLLARYAPGTKPAQLKSILKSPSMLFLGAGVLWAFVVTRGTNISYIDDYTHWYHVCKVLHFDGLLPHTTELEFYNYVPGTALMITLLTDCVGFSAENCFFAQNCLHMAFLCALFAPMECEAGKRNRALCCCVTLAGCALVMGATYGVYELLVDIIIALTAAAAFALMVFGPKGGLRDAGVVVILCFCALIKNTGLLFAALTGGFWFVCCRGEKENGKRALMTALVPVAVNLSYLLRTKLIFAGAQDAPHSLSAGRFLAVFKSKTWEWIFEVIGKYLHRTAGLEGTPQVLVFWLLIAVLAIAALSIGRNRTASIARAAAICAAVSGAAYIAFLLGMYLFSMPMGEDWTLAAYERYMGTIVVYIGALATLTLSQMTLNAPACASIFAAAALIPGLLLLPPGYLLGYTHYRPVYPYTRTMADLANAALPEGAQRDTGSYLVLWDIERYPSFGDHYMKARYCVRTKLRAEDVTAFNVDSFMQYVMTDEESMERMRERENLVLLSDLSDYPELADALGVESLTPGIHPIDNENRRESK